MILSGLPLFESVTSRRVKETQLRSIARQQLRAFDLRAKGCGRVLLAGDQDYPA